MKRSTPSRWHCAAQLIVAAVALFAVLLQVAQAAPVASAKPASPAGPAGTAAATAGPPALAVLTTRPQPARLPLRVAANGNIAAWQENSIGSTSEGLRLAEVLVQVGDRVRRGQVLARFDTALLDAELASRRAAWAEAEASAAEALANAGRAQALQASGAMSAQQIGQFQLAAHTAQARRDAAQAQLQAQQLRLAQSLVRAPDDGVISASLATVGAVPSAGQALFRLIRRQRLEWRAEVPAAQLAQLAPGQAVSVVPVGGPVLRGTVRSVAPVVDPSTRNGLVYVDLPVGSAARAGMFARGDIDIGAGPAALTLPATAVLQREGGDCVFTLGAGARVVQTRVTIGRRAGDRVEVLAGIDASSRVVAAGASFLADGDRVRVVDGPPPHAPAASPSPPVQ
ncbi:efflux RND transporter periplasmic adaptor subunit [Aquabacterium sp. OR-4]|uniref:efflux RND transporter periplasmic adaptor subunit n=1 Tax=Aquabacterium sp. OR-4 TaxID=2978127 RepID=UPI0021B23402|nr:efflux RND transporter periplasmic adaptor subunit [Aquabacterium sp. OR-4]MDT7835044.1 efflux RND transporter periplasmic adaptor subunit [Aquabacterium sp. OR-4]